MGERPLFLERRSYRQRRLMDVVRFMPFVCATLWILIPLLWPKTVPEATPMSSALYYIFAIWTTAICATFALWYRLRRGKEAAD